MSSTDHHLPNPFPGLRPFRSDEHHCSLAARSRLMCCCSY